MAVNLSPIGGVAGQFFDNNGNPLSGGKIFTYSAGTTTPQTSYTSASGTTPHANPIILDAAGRVPGGEIWLTDGLQYKFIIQTSNNVLIGTYDNIIGINSNFVNYTNAQEIQTATAGQTVFTLTTMQYQPGTNSLSVFVDGVNQYGPGAMYAYQETSSTVVTFTAGLHVGAQVKFVTSAINASSYGDAEQINYTPPFTSSVPTNVEDKLSEYVSVQDFGAVGDGVTDDTAAFNAAIATGRNVIVPWTASGYVVNNVSVVSNMSITGEKSGISSTTCKLIVTSNNAGAFRQSTSNPVFQVYIGNLAIEAASSVTGACAYKQDDKSIYTAYCVFENIETSANLLLSYDGFFIFTEWRGCRDGYIGTAGAQGHGWINCIPSSWSQPNKANLNVVRNSHCFDAVAGSAAIAAAVDIGYGVNWSFDGCDFEDLTLQAVRTRGVFNVNFQNGWFERITAAQVATFDVSPTPDGSRPVSFDNCTFDLVNTTTYCVTVGAASNVAFRNCGFIAVPTGVVLANSALGVTNAENLQVFSGLGASGFLTGINTAQYQSGKLLLNGATDDGSGSVVQLTGLSRATGFTSSYDITVSTTFVNIGAFSYVGGLAVVNGYNTAGGATGVWLVGFRNGAAAVWASSDATATTPSFQMSSTNLQMKTTTGTLKVSVALLL